jgi:hypothetical protein
VKKTLHAALRKKVLRDFKPLPPERVYDGRGPRRRRRRMLGRINKVIGLDRVVEPQPELLFVLAIWSQYWGENVPDK